MKEILESTFKHSTIDRLNFERLLIFVSIYLAKNGEKVVYLYEHHK